MNPFTIQHKKTAERWIVLDRFVEHDLKHYWNSFLITNSNTGKMDVIGEDYLLKNFDFIDLHSSRNLMDVLDYMLSNKRS